WRGQEQLVLSGGIGADSELHLAQVLVVPARFVVVQPEFALAVETIYLTMAGLEGCQPTAGAGPRTLVIAIQEVVLGQQEDLVLAVGIGADAEAGAAATRRFPTGRIIAEPESTLAVEAEDLAVTGLNRLEAALRIGHLALVVAEDAVVGSLNVDFILAI